MTKSFIALLAILLFPSLTSADQCIPDDLIVTSSACIGFDCACNVESFGFDTIRLKENNLRIKFEDTSVGGFPTRDWQLTANDSANGGMSRFSIDDVDSGRTVFTVEGGAPSSSLYVDDGGRVGLGTSTPATELHIVDGDSPTLRFDQDGSGGFTPQRWDVAGNEANFFVRDVTGGSKLPLRIRPGAPTSSIDIAADGDVGLNTASPAAALHVLRTGTNPVQILAEESVVGGDAFPLKLVAKRKLRISTVNNGAQWTLDNEGTAFNIAFVGNAFQEFRVDQNGNVTVAGTVTANGVLLTSDRNLKSDVEPVSPLEVLERLDRVPISTWRFTDGREGTRHLGPMAQDFHSAFGLGGDDDRHLSLLDVGGVSLAAIQGLRQQLRDERSKVEQLRRDTDRRISTLQRERDDLVRRIETLEARLADAR
jgi:hypothetical protein